MFDEKALELHRKRAASRFSPLLFTEIATRLTDRLRDIRRTFAHILDLTPFHTGTMAPFLSALYPEAHLQQADESHLASFEPHTFDGILSVLNLHWIQDVPSFLRTLRHLLRPDGLLIAAFWGENSLHELRTALIQAETTLQSGVSPRVSPMISVFDAAALLQQAGFALPVVDHDTMTVDYDDLASLGRHLRAMGENNALKRRLRAFTPRELFQLAETLYRQAHETKEKKIPATFQLITLTGWAPDPSQPQALKPGSARHHLGDILQDAKTR